MSKQEKSAASDDGDDGNKDGVEEWRMEYAWNTHSYINEYIRFADAKAAAVILFCSGLLAGLFTAGVHHLFVHSVPLNWGIWGMLAFASFFLLAVGVAAAGWATLPRLWSAQIQPGYIFWGRILAHGEPNIFTQAMRSKSRGELFDQVSGHLFDLSNVCRSKYLCVKVSLWSASLGALISAFVVLQMPITPAAPGAGVAERAAQVPPAPSGDATNQPLGTLGSGITNIPTASAATTNVVGVATSRNGALSKDFDVTSDSYAASPSHHLLEVSDLDLPSRQFKWLI